MNIKIEKVLNSNFISIKNKLGLEVVLCSFGASIYEIKINDVLMNISPKDKIEFLNSNAYFGKTIGRISGRIKDGILNFNNKEYKLSQNEGNNHLHGGYKGLSFVDFKYQIDKEIDKAIVTFSYLSIDKEEGYPGNARINVKYIIKENDLSIDIIHFSKVDKNTPIGLTNHTYFNLGGYDSIKEHVLTIPSKRIVETDKDLLPLKEIEVPSLLDFSNPKQLDEVINDKSLLNSKAKGLDHHYLLDNGKITLSNNKYNLHVTTDYPCVVIYSMNYFDNKVMMNTNKYQNKNMGIAIECSENHLKLNDMVSKKDTVKTRHISFIFSLKQN